ncbi:MAG: hypothetical protein ACPGLY_24835, partial [Rubripirellula sp.]
LVSDSGEVQCLRDEAEELPTFNIQPKLTTTEEPEAVAPPQNQPANDPFGGGGGGNDPFGGGGAGNDPFGGGGAGADPFGGGGAGADPFGGNPF